VSASKARYNAGMRGIPALGAFVLVACGCGAAPVTPAAELGLDDAPARGPNGWATTRIVVVDHLSWPYRLVDLDVSVDGLDVYGGEDVVDLRGRRRVVGVVELEPGAHALEVRTRAAVPAAPLGSDDCIVTLRDRRDIRVGLVPAVVVLDLHARNVTDRFDQRLAVRVELDGADQRGEPVIEGGPQCAAEVPFEPHRRFVDEEHVIPFHP
jgi:hypothetical protein